MCFKIIEGRGKNLKCHKPALNEGRWAGGFCSLSLGRRERGQDSGMGRAPSP